MGEWKGTSGGSWVDFACAYLRAVPKRDDLGARMYNVFHNFWLLQGGIHHNKYFDGRWDGRWECGKQQVKLVTYTRTHTHGRHNTTAVLVGCRADEGVSHGLWWHFPFDFSWLADSHTREQLDNKHCVCVSFALCVAWKALHTVRTWVWHFHTHSHSHTYIHKSSFPLRARNNNTTYCLWDVLTSQGLLSGGLHTFHWIAARHKKIQNQSYANRQANFSLCYETVAENCFPVFHCLSRISLLSLTWSWTVWYKRHEVAVKPSTVCYCLQWPAKKSAHYLQFCIFSIISWKIKLLYCLNRLIETLFGFYYECAVPYRDKNEKFAFRKKNYKKKIKLK